MAASTVGAYPFASQWIEQAEQSRAAEMLAEGAANTGPSIISAERAEAEAYNDHLARGIAYDGRPYQEQIQLTEASHADGVIARLRVPSVSIDQPVRRTLEEHSLVTGTGHAEESSLPVGGPSTHAVLGGHRGMADSVGFTDLPNIKIGDEIFIDVLGETLVYEVKHTETLEPLEAAYHPIEAGKDIVSLVTCTPLGINSHRFVVKAERVFPEPAPAPPIKSELPGFPWWLVIYISALVLILIYGCFQFRSIHKLAKVKRQREEEKLLTPAE